MTDRALGGRHTDVFWAPGSFLTECSACCDLPGALSAGLLDLGLKPLPERSGIAVVTFLLNISF